MTTHETPQRPCAKRRRVRSSRLPLTTGARRKFRRILVQPGLGTRPHQAGPKNAPMWLSSDHMNARLRPKRAIAVPVSRRYSPGSALPVARRLQGSPLDRGHMRYGQALLVLTVIGGLASPAAGEQEASLGPARPEQPVFTQVGLATCYGGRAVGRATASGWPSTVSPRRTARCRSAPSCE